MRNAGNRRPGSLRQSVSALPAPRRTRKRTTLQITAVDTPSREDWSEAFLGCDYATFFQSPEWAELWERFSGGQVRSAAERFTFSDGCVAILPLSFESRLQGLLSRHVASPQGTFGGWVSRDALTAEHADALLERLVDGRSGSLVWRMNPYDPLVFAAGRRRGLSCRPDETHALRLDAGPKALLRGFKNGYRSDVKKAINRGHLAVSEARDLDEWRAYYRVYQETLTRWGHAETEGYPWELFETMANLHSPRIKLWLGRYDGAIVSGELCLYAKRHVVSWHAATLKDFLRSHVAKVQIFHVIQDACERGFHWFDFNPSAGLDGVRTFKESFNAQPLPAPVVYVDSTLKSVVRGLAASLNVPYAELSLQPLGEVVRPPSSPPSAT